MADQSTRIHLIPYNYSLVHHNPGVPLTQNKIPLFHLAPPQGGVYDHTLNNVFPNSPPHQDSLVTESLLLQLTDCDTLEEIRVLSLRNKDLPSCLKTLSQCQNLTIAYLQGNTINMHDLMYLQLFTNLKKIDLSNNHINGLPSNPQIFAGLVNCKFLYLHNNRISTWNDVKALTGLPSIMHITLFNNPCASIPGYRHFLVNSISSLLALDNFVITDEERIEDVSFGYRFRALNEYMKLHIPDYAKEKSAEQHLFNLEVDIYRLKRIFERNSPAVLIQSLYRGYRSRNYVKVYFNERKQKIIKIQKVVRGWLMRKRLKKDLRDMLRYTGQEYLLMSNIEIRRKHAALRIKRCIVKRFREKRRKELEIASALTIQKHYRGRFIRNTIFINALELKKNQRIYFLKEQRPLFVKILRSLLPLFEQKYETYSKIEQLLSCIREDYKYETVRVMEPDLFEYRHLPIVQFSKPSLFSKIRRSKQKTRQILSDENQSHLFQDPEFSLFNLYYKQEHEYSLLKHRWNTIELRNCKVHKDRVIESIMKRKRNVGKNQYFFQDQYRDFLVFEGPPLDILASVCFAVLDYNRQAHHDSEQQLLLFFDKVLERAAGASKIQMAFRASNFRKHVLNYNYPIYNLIKRRAAFCIQRQWSNFKLRKRMYALTLIKRHLDRIKSHEIFIEQSLYVNIQAIVNAISDQLKFEEQRVVFDFVQNTVQMTVLETPKTTFRYEYFACPRWLGINFKSLEFEPTKYQNDLQAFFHLNDQDCQILPSNYVINYEQTELDIDRQLYFLQIKCNSVEEAKRRAYLLAILTYDLHQHLFVPLNTSDMLQDPFQMQKIYKIKQRFDLMNQTESVDVKTLFADQLQQRHLGLILSEKDQKLIRFNLSYKTVQLAENSKRALHIQSADQRDAFSIDIENQRREGLLLMFGGGSKQWQQQVTSQRFYEQKKLHEEMQREVKEKRLMTIKEAVNEFKDYKVTIQSSHQQNAEKYLEHKRDEVQKLREISKIIQHEQKNELNKNLSVFLALNKEEKSLRKELVDKQVEVDVKEKFLKKMTVIQHHKNRQAKKEETDKFINAFSQAKNLIEKSMKIGNKIKDNKIRMHSNQERVQKAKDSKNESKILSKQAIKSVLFENSIDFIASQQQNSRAQAHKFEIKNSSYITNNNPHVFTTQTNNRVTTMADEYASNSRSKLLLNQNKSNTKSQNRSHFLPPLGDTSFSENMRNQSSKLNYGTASINQTYSIGRQNEDDIELTKDIQEIYKSTVKGRQNWKRSFTRAVFAEESYPIIKNTQTNMSFQYSEQSQDINTFLQQPQYQQVIENRDISKYSRMSNKKRTRGDTQEIRVSERLKVLNNL